MSNPLDPKACSERADSLSVSEPLAVSEPVAAEAPQDTDESRRPPRRKERARVKASKRQREAAAPDGASTSETADGAHVRLSTNCTIRDCSALKADLSAVLAAPAAVSIDVSALERIDTAAIQLLCAFVRDRKARDLGVTFCGKSPAFDDAARLLGVDTVLDLRDAVAAAP